MGSLEKRRSKYKYCKDIIFYSIPVACIWHIFFAEVQHKQKCDSHLIHYQPYPVDDNSCIRRAWRDNETDPVDLKPADNIIFFPDTTCKGGFTSRQGCSIESAARAHPDYTIQVLMTGPMHSRFKNGSLYKILQNFDNVKISHINMIDYAKGTPLEAVFSEDIALFFDFTNDAKKFNIEELLKFLTLYKYGGVFMEMDFIIVNSFVTLERNWIGKDLKDELGPGVLSFSNNKLGRKLANITISDLVKNYNPFIYDNGYGTIKRTLEEICSTKKIKEMEADLCQGLEFYDNSIFYPVKYELFDMYLSKTDISMADTYTAYAHHMWSSYTGGERFTPGSRIAKIAETFCPDVYRLYRDDFGL